MVKAGGQAELDRINAHAKEEAELTSLNNSPQRKRRS